MISSIHKLLVLLAKGRCRWARQALLGWLVLGLVGCGLAYPIRTVHPTQPQYFVFLDKQSSQFVDQWVDIGAQQHSGEQILDRLVQLISHGLDELNAYLPEPGFFMHSGQRAGIAEGANALITLSELDDVYDFGGGDYTHGHVSMGPEQLNPQANSRVIGTGQMRVQTVFAVKRYLLHESIPLELVQSTAYSMDIQFSDAWIWQQLTMAGDPPGVVGGSTAQQAEQMIKMLLFHELGHGLGLAHSHDPDDVMHPVITVHKDIAAFGAQVAAHFRVSDDGS